MAIGTVTQVIGAVVDVKFPLDAIPAIYNALKAKISFAGTERHITLEVQQHLEDGVVRTVAMTSTEGLRRGSPAEDTGSPITVPVGNATLGRIFNVTGDPVDEKGEMTSCQRLPIHRNPPPLVDQSTRAEILETEAKCSVSQLANKAESEKYAFKSRPSFMSEGGLTAAERALSAALTGNRRRRRR